LTNYHLPTFLFLFIFRDAEKEDKAEGKAHRVEDKNKIKINLVFVLLYCVFSVCFVSPVVFFCFMLYPCVVVSC
jgi:hypothetical protein